MAVPLGGCPDCIRCADAVEFCGIGLRGHWRIGPDEMMPIWLIKHWQWAGMAACLLLGFLGGWNVRDWKSDSDALKAVQKADKERERLTIKADAAAASYEAVRAKLGPIQHETRNTVREIYRDVQIPGGCAAPDAVRGLLQERVDSVNAVTSGEPTSILPEPAVNP